MQASNLAEAQQRKELFVCRAGELEGVVGGFLFVGGLHRCLGANPQTFEST